MKFSRSLLGFAVACAGLGGAAAACGDEETTINPATTDGGGTGSETSTTTDGSPTADTGGPGPSDAGPDGEPITDGGGNIDPDAGDEPDAAICNALANDAPAVDSECISSAPIFGGGALVAGKYYLTAVRLHAPLSFCQNTFQKATFKTTMDLIVDGNGVGISNTIGQVQNGPARTRTTTLDPPANNASPLVATPTCPPRPGGNVPYASAVRNDGKQVLVIRAAYGANAIADYVYVKQ